MALTFLDLKKNVSIKETGKESLEEGFIGGGVCYY